MEPLAWNPGSILTSLEEIPFCKQWGEGKESNAFANGADDFLNARLRLVLRKSLLGGPLVGPYRICFHSPHPIVQERKFQAVGRALWLSIHMEI